MNNKQIFFGLIVAVALMSSCKNSDDTPGNIAPGAAFRSSKSTAVIGASVNFMDESSDKDGEITKWMWDFGDGLGVSTNQNPTYSYEKEGEFVVSLTVSDNTGAVAKATGTVKVEGKFATKWEFSDFNDVIGASAPVLSEDGMIFIGSEDTKVYGIKNDGTMAWSYNTGSKIISTGAYADGKVYFGTVDGKLYSLNASSGEFNWAYELDDPVLIGGPSITSDGIILIGTGNKNKFGVFHGINPDGFLVWLQGLDGLSLDIKVRTAGTISNDGSTVYFGTTIGILYALNAKDGSISWQFEANANIESTPAIASDGTIYFGADNGFLYAVNSNGSEKWRIKLGEGKIRSSPAIGIDGTIYIGVKETKSLHAVSSSGTEKWSFVTGGEVMSDPFIGDDGVIYFGSFDGKLYTINADGTERFSITSRPDLQEQGNNGNPVDGRVGGGPVVQNGTLYYGAYDGVLRAVTVPSQSSANSDWPMRGYNPQRVNRK